MKYPELTDPSGAMPGDDVLILFSYGPPGTPMFPELDDDLTASRPEEEELVSFVSGIVQLGYDAYSSGTSKWRSFHIDDADHTLLHDPAGVPRKVFVRAPGELRQAVLIGHEAMNTNEDLARKLASASITIVELAAKLEEVKRIHRRSPTPFGTYGVPRDHQGKHHCLGCTTSSNDQTLYTNFPCATALTIGATEDGYTFPQEPAHD
jgi:hypothetical protein